MSWNARTKSQLSEAWHEYGIHTPFLLWMGKDATSTFQHQSKICQRFNSGETEIGGVQVQVGTHVGTPEPRGHILRGFRPLGHFPKLKAVAFPMPGLDFLDFLM